MTINSIANTIIKCFKKEDITINGDKYSGSSITINGNKVIIDGENIGNFPKLDIVIHGDCKEVSSTSGNITVNGNSSSVKTTSGDITCADISGNVKTTSGDVRANIINGNISTASGDIKCK